MTSDDPVTLRQSELRARLADAWDEGAAAERGGDNDQNPYRDWCPVPYCGQKIAAHSARLCADHERQLCVLLDAAKLPRPESPAPTAWSATHDELLPT